MLQDCSTMDQSSALNPEAGFSCLLMSVLNGTGRETKPWKRGPRTSLAPWLEPCLSPAWPYPWLCQAPSKACATGRFPCPGASPHQEGKAVLHRLLSHRPALMGAVWQLGRALETEELELDLQLPAFVCLMVPRPAISWESWASRTCHGASSMQFTMSMYGPAALGLGRDGAATQPRPCSHLQL